MSHRSKWNAGALRLRDVQDDSDDRPHARIVLVSDDEPLRLLLQALLSARGYDVAASDSARALASPQSLKGFVVGIVDFSACRADAVRVHSLLRATGAAVISISAGKDGAPAPDELGCEVRLRKPFDPRALLLIVRGVLADEVEAPQSQSMIRVGPIGLSRLLNVATVASREIELTDAETRILHELLINAGSPVTRERLTKRALLRDWSPEDRSLDAHINRLRRKLGNDRRGHTPIRTVRGFGYRLLAEWEPDSVTAVAMRAPSRHPPVGNFSARSRE